MTPLPDGWLTDNEADELQRLAAGHTVLELGAWKGRSTVALAATARYVVSVDRHHGIPGWAPGDSLDDYLANVRDLPNVGIVIADFVDIAEYLSGFDLVFVDGDHDTKAVERDGLIAAALGSVVAFHDWQLKRVRNGARAAFHYTEPAYVIDSLAVYK